MDEKEFESLVEDYGLEYLHEKDPDRAPFAMGELPEIMPVNDSDSYFRLMMSMFFGYRWQPSAYQTKEKEPFNPNDEYCAFNAYANLVSINKYDYIAYLKDVIDEDYFEEYCKEQGYIDEEDEDEEVESSVRKPRFAKRLQASLKRRILSRKSARKFERKPLK